jgi:magnesium chelatase family protein
MASARTHCAALIGIDAHIVEVEADIANGPPGMTLTGLPDTALREARDRIRAAVINSGYDWPPQRITVGLFPAWLPKRGSWSDLAIAVAVVAAAGAVPQDAAGGVMFLGELGLDGRLRPVRGVLPAVAAAARTGFGTVVLAAENAAEAALVPGMTVVGAGTLTQVIGWLRSDGPAGMPGLADPGPADAAPAQAAGTPGVTASAEHRPGSEPCLLHSYPQALRAAEICAAGGHHLSLLGPPGTPVTAVAALVRDLLPGLDHQTALEVTAVHSLAGMLHPGAPLISYPPFVAPHHTASKAAILGCGTAAIRPGAVSLAHRGVLFLDEAPEFGRDVLDALRQPLESGQITLARSGVTATFPARFTLIVAARPCPCAKTAGGAGDCSCSPAARRRYLGRISGPLLDRVDVKIELRPPGRYELLDDHGLAGPSPAAAAQVAAARDCAARRMAGTPWRLNSEIPGSELRRHWPPAPGALTGVERALDLGQISARAVAKILRLAWTLADLAGTSRPGRDDCDTALNLYLGVTP